MLHGIVNVAMLKTLLKLLVTGIYIILYGLFRGGPIVAKRHALGVCNIIFSLIAYFSHNKPPANDIFIPLIQSYLPILHIHFFYLSLL